jgi:hypothetical protein
MFNPISAAIPAIVQQPSEAKSERFDAVNDVFKVFHGFYGNLFLSKYSTGQVGKAGDVNASGRSIEGQDLGVLSAKQIWSHGLRGFDRSTIKSALTQCMERNPEFPPSLPQLVALCKAAQPRAAYVPDIPAIAMGAPLRSRYAAQAREINAKHAAQVVQKRLGAIEFAPGIDGLKQAIAGAVGAAGGDEVHELLRLDKLLAKRVAV